MRALERSPSPGRHGGWGAAMAAVLAMMATWMNPRASEANAARDALAQATAAMAAQPPDRNAARAALTRATKAEDDAVAVADAFLGLGRMDRDERAYTGALTNYRACVATAPETLWAHRAAQEIAWLSARSEGGFAPLDRFEGVELDPARATDLAAIDALGRDGDGFPPGVVRLEARRFVADAWLSAPNRRADAISELRKVKGDLKYAEPLTNRTVERELVDALLADQRLDEVRSEITSSGDLLDPPFVAYARRLLRRRTIQRAARVELILFAVIAILAAGRRHRGMAWGLDTPASLGVRGAVALGIGITAASATFLLLEILQPTYLNHLGL